MEKDKLLLGKTPCQLYQFWLYLQLSSSRTGMANDLYLMNTGSQCKEIQEALNQVGL